MGQIAHNYVIFERVARHRCQLRPGRDGRRLPIGDEPESDGPFGDGVGKVAPGFDELVEVQVEGPKQRTDDRPVQLLPDQREVKQRVQGRLQVLADALALMRHLERRQIGRCCR